MKNLISIFLFLLLSCGNESKIKEPDIPSEVLVLQNSLEKRTFLEGIAKSDQELRIKLRDPNLSVAEVDELWSRQHEIDFLNLLKIEHYLKLYGYPSKSELGETAALAPWMVIHHQTNYETRKKFFQPLYKAWLEGNIDAGALSFYLNRTYWTKTGERNQMPSPYKAEEEIELLIEKLELEKEKLAVLESRKEIL